MSNKFRILALNGGGARGILQAAFLVKLENETGKKVHQLFDLVVGTSTGGIIASSVAKGLPAERIFALYNLNMHKIFHRSFLWKIKSGFGVLDSKYEIDGLLTSVSKYLGSASIAEAKVPFITTAFDTLTEDVFLFKSWKPEHRKYSFTDTAVSTACAPTFFPPYKVDDRNLIDGGIYAGNPVMIGAVEGIKKGYSIDDINILNVGTGFDFEGHDTSRFGIKEWLIKGESKPLLDMIFSSTDEKDSYLSGKLFPNYVYINQLLENKYPMDTTNRDILCELTAIGGKLYDSNRESILKLLTDDETPGDQLSTSQWLTTRAGLSL